MSMLNRRAILRNWGGFLAGVTCAWVLLVGGATHAQQYVVSGGASASNSTPVTYPAGMYVYGTDGSGNRSTYTANAPLTAGAGGVYGIIVAQQGLFVANADVIAEGDLLVGTGGSVTLASGTLFTPYISLSGSNAIAQTGGHFATNDVYLYDGASLQFQAGDVINGSINATNSSVRLYAPLEFGSPGAFLSFSGSAGSLITNGNNVDLIAFFGGFLHVDSGAIVNRTGGGTISASYFEVTGAGSTLTLLTGDSFTGNSSVYAGGSVSNPVATTIAGSLTLGNAGSSYTANAPLTLSRNAAGYELQVSDGAVFTANANVTAPQGQIYVSGGVFNLASGTLTASTLGLDGAGSFVRTGAGERITLGAVSLDNAASLTFRAGDTVTDAMSLNTSSTVALNTALTTGQLTLNAAGTRLITNGNDVTVDSLSIESGAVVVRPGTGTITANSVSVSGTGSAFTIRAGDSAGSIVTVSNGASVTNTAATAVGSMIVQGSGATYTANAPLTLTGSTGGSELQVYADAVFQANANLTVAGGGITVEEGGVLNLLSGTLTADFLNLDGAGSFSKGGSLALGDPISGGGLSLSGGATLTIDVGDSLMGAVTVNGSGSLLTANAPLSLASLVLGTGGKLALTSFSGSWDGRPTALELDGNVTTTLQNYLTSSLLLISNNPEPVAFVFDGATNKTYVTVTAVPEPSTYAMALAGLACGGFSMWRRRKRA